MFGVEDLVRVWVLGFRAAAWTLTNMTFRIAGLGFKA